MGVVFLENLISANLPVLTLIATNGECRFLALSDSTATDAQGFISSGYAPRTTSFIRCSWMPKKDVAEQESAAQTRASFVYEIAVPKVVGGVEVIAKPSDRLELKLKLGETETETLEIVAVVNQTNVFWKVYAVDIEE